MIAWLINKNLCLQWNLRKLVGRKKAVCICILIEKLFKRR